MAAGLSELKQVYLIYGAEDLLLEQALSRLKRMVGEVADLDFNMDAFDGESVNADDVVAACNTLPFVSERRLVIVKNVDKMARDGQEVLAQYAADPAPTTVLVLVAVKLAKNSRLFKTIDKMGGASEYAAPRKSDYPREVQRLVSDRGRTVTREGAETLVQAVGFDLRRLSAEIDKLVAYAGERAEITHEDVVDVVSQTAETSVFEFTEALANRDARASLRLLGDVLDQGESIFGVHALALRQVRDLIAARSMIDRGQGSLAEIARAVGRPDWQLRNVPRQARAFTGDELVGAIRSAAQTEAQMKTSRDPRLVFERWIVKVCG